MKAESPVLARQRECHEEIKKGQTKTLNFLAGSNVHVLWFHLHSCVSDMRPIFRAHPLTGAVIFISLYIFIAGVQQLFYPVISSSQTHFQTRVIPLLLPGFGRRTHHFPMGPQLRRRFETSVFFQVISNYCSHSPMTC